MGTKDIQMGKSLIFKVGSVLTASAIVCLGLVGCNSETSGPPQTTDAARYPMTVTDHADRSVVIAARPTKIVSLLPSHTEIAFDLGLGDMIVGVDDYSDYPAAALTKTKVGNLYGVNFEAIVAAAPDLILIDISALDLGVVDTLAGLMPACAILVVKGTQVDSFQDVYDAIELIGKVTDTENKASQIVTDMKTRVKAITDKTISLTTDQKPRTVYIIWPDPLYVHGGGALGSVLIEAAGGTNIFKNAGDSVSLEALISLNPQVILASASVSMGDASYQFALNDSRLDSTDARINGKIYGMNDDLTGRPTPRLVEGLEAMAKLLHPEIFS
ncbi:vitamin B-12 ABC transporter BtuF [Dehalogenimonas sp. WBC-2]|nr:vitamin B-12 ABC transporter BtuF [Dehalogenimonas sp. WBC-2]